MVEADEEMDKKLSEEKRERKNTNIEHKKMFVKMFMKKIGLGDVPCSELYIDIDISGSYYLVNFIVIAEIEFNLYIRIPVNSENPKNQYPNYYHMSLHSTNNKVSFFIDFGNTNISGDQNILNDKPKSKYIFDYFVNDGHNKIQSIIRELYPFIFATDYMQNLPKAYTFLLCCPGIIPKGVDKIIAKKILF
jgi:hypothetical protein